MIFAYQNIATSDAPTDGAWNWWMDKDGNVEFARMKEDAYDHFYPSTKHLNLRETDWEPQSLSGYFKEVNDEEASKSIDPLDEMKYFSCGIDSFMLPDVYAIKCSLWFEDKKAGELVAANDSVIDYNVIRFVFELETEFNWLWDRKLGDFNFKIEFDRECGDIQLRLWRKE